MRVDTLLVMNDAFRLVITMSPRLRVMRFGQEPVHREQEMSKKN